MRLVLLAGWLAVAAAFRPSSHTPPSSSASSRDVWNPWAVSSDDPEPQLLVAEHVAPAFKVHVTDAFSPTSDPPRRERINEARKEKLKLAAALGSVFDSDSAER
jgi:DNA-binding XRE family transcriptional regulator